MGQQRVTAGRRVVGVVVLALVASVLGLESASAAPTAGPAPVRHLLSEAQRSAAQRSAAQGPAAQGPAQQRSLAQQAPTGARHTFRIPGDDDETFVGFNPGCATGRGKAKPNAFVYTDSKVKLDWVLTGTKVLKKGTVKTKSERAVALKLPSVRTGSYRVTLALHHQTDLLADETFDVLPCVVVTTSCRAVTFINPAGNPTAYVTYRGHDKKQEFDLQLAAGASRTVRADYAKIDYDATTDDPDVGTGSVGHATVKVKQCGHTPAQPGLNALQSSGFAGCSVSGAPATVTLSWSSQPSLKDENFQVLDSTSQPVAAGKVRGGHDTDVALAAGTYTYRSYANGLEQPFEDVAFTVLGCVEVTPLCRAIQVGNPNGVAVTAVVYSTEDKDVPGDGDLTDVPADGSATIPWTGSGAWVLAFAQDALTSSGAGFVSLASALTADGEPVTTDVPQDC